MGVPSTQPWAGGTPLAFDYTQGGGGGNSLGDYNPSYGSYSASFNPLNSFSSSLIGGRLQKYYGDNPSPWMDFTDPATGGSVGTGGNVSKNPDFGQFAKTPEVYAEIEAAANKYGVPANLLKAMIARESSGDWAANSHATYLASRGQRIVGYTGIVEDTAKSWGYDFNALIGNRALQIDAMANGLNRLYSQVGGQYGWDGVIATYYSGDPTGLSTPGDSIQYGTTKQYVASVKGWWQAEDAWTKANGGTVGGQVNLGLNSPATPEWQPVNQWDQMVAQAAAKYGVPPNLVKSIIRLESNGNPSAQHPASGATGLMQIMPEIWNNGNSQQLLDPAYNIDMGTMILKSNYDQHGSWEMAAKAYLGLVGADANGTTSSMYWDTVSKYWKELDGTMAAPGTSGGGVMPISAVWGNAPGVSISSPHMNVSDWVINNTSIKYGGRYTGERGMYDYAVEQFGRMGHPGVDYAMPPGTNIYTPVGGTVIVAGSGSYGDDHGGIGEIRIRMDNGHELIFGHMGGGAVQVGQRVPAGTFVGTSGTAGSGPHLHLEYRVPSTNTPSGWDSVDPANLTTGGMVTTLGSPTLGVTAGRPQPTTYQDMIIAIMRGQNVNGENVSSGNGWNDWLVANLWKQGAY